VTCPELEMLRTAGLVLDHAIAEFAMVAEEPSE
jgi:hypothetical protein